MVDVGVCVGEGERERQREKGLCVCVSAFVCACWRMCVFVLSATSMTTQPPVLSPGPDRVLVRRFSLLFSFSSLSSPDLSSSPLPPLFV